jgi:tripartite-type tricarboxylate transporter receptor subunit TctC
MGTNRILRVFGAGLAALAGAIVFTAGNAAQADSAADFYKGKRISLMISSGPGPGYDFFARLLAPHLSKHVPGNPRIIPQNQPGAGGMKLLNFAYNQGPRDGTMIFTLHTALPLQQVLGQRGVRYDASKLIAIGRIAAGNSTTAVWHKTGIKSIADLKNKDVLIGGSTATSSTVIFPTVARNMLGLKLKVVAGYSGMRQVMLAMERGELGGFGNLTLASLSSSYPHYLSKGLITPLVQWGLTREKDWANVPLASELTDDPVARKAVEVLSAQMEIGRSYYLPPGVPGDRVAALRKAVKDTVADPEFQRRAEKTKAEIRYMSGPDLEKIIADVLSAPKPAVERLKTLMVRSGGGRCDQYSDVKVCRKAKKKKKKKKQM